MKKIPVKQLLLLVTGVCLIFLLLRYKLILKSTYFRIGLYNQSYRNETKYILFWNKMFRSPILYFPTDGFGLFKHCEVKNCYATSIKNLLPVDEYHAIIFHIPNQGKPGEEVMPERRRDHQRYIFATLESPLYYYGNHTQYVFDNFFNWTMTYRLDSDIPRRYGYVERNVLNNYQLPSKEEIRKKKSIAWMVSNCNSFNRREDLVEDLRKYIDVDVYGECGNLTCPKESDCYTMLEENYRFYLSFENAHCDDYITEKLFRTLQKNVIPIVFGGGNYKEVAPPNSYINVEDFQNVKDLANYLTYLEANLENYLEYFEWKRNHLIHLYDEQAVCTLCKKLHDPYEARKTYTNIKHWWWDNSKNWGCTKTEIPRNNVF